MSKFDRRDFLKAGAATAAAGVLPAPFIWPKGAQAADTVKVGILHSLTGTIAIAEKSVVDAEMLTIEEINKAGGVMGHKIEDLVGMSLRRFTKFTNQHRRAPRKNPAKLLAHQAAARAERWAVVIRSWSRLKPTDPATRERFKRALDGMVREVRRLKRRL